MSCKKLYVFTVVGEGHFPYDMLRRDCCWPANSKSVEAMYWDGSMSGEDDGPRKVRLESHQSPNIERWNSFSWKCQIDLVDKL